MNRERRKRCSYLWRVPPGFDPEVEGRKNSDSRIGALLVIGITGPYAGSAGVAPQLSHVGTGGWMPYQTDGMVTRPPHSLQVPIVWSPLMLVSLQLRQPMLRLELLRSNRLR